MSADTRISNLPVYERIRQMILKENGLTEPFPGIKATKEHGSRESGVKLRYIIASENNPLGYAPGMYVHTNLPPEKFAERYGYYEAIIANYSLLEFFHYHGHYLQGFALQRAYIDQKSMGVIFRIDKQ